MKKILSGVLTVCLLLSSLFLIEGAAVDCRAETYQGITLSIEAPTETSAVTSTTTIDVTLKLKVPLGIYLNGVKVSLCYESRFFSTSSGFVTLSSDIPSGSLNLEEGMVSFYYDSTSKPIETGEYTLFTATFGVDERGLDQELFFTTYSHEAYMTLYDDYGMVTGESDIEAYNDSVGVYVGERFSVTPSYSTVTVGKETKISLNKACAEFYNYGEDIVSYDAETQTVTALSLGTAKLEFTAESGETVMITFVVRKFSPDDVYCVMEYSSCEYDGNPKAPQITVKNDNGDTLTEGVEYTVEYPEAVEVGTYEISIQLMGDYYSGAFSLNFSILECEHMGGTASCIEKAVCHKCNREYGTYADHTGGNATCTEKAKCTVCGDYYGSLKAHTYKTTTATKATTSKNGSTVTKCTVCGYKKSSGVIYKISSVAISATSYTYNGKVKTPSVTVKNSKGTKLVKGTDYTVSYAGGRKNVGKYKVKITFKGKYSGSKALYFTINPQKTSVKKLTPATKALKVSITKKTAQVTGYQIQYSTSKSFSSAKKITTSSTSKTVKSLKAKKTYYVRVRTYKKAGGKTYYSAWSAIKKKKTK